MPAAACSSVYSVLHLRLRISSRESRSRNSPTSVTTPTAWPGAAVADLGRHRRIDIDADDLHPARQHVAGGDGMQHGAETEHQAGGFQLRGVGVLRRVHVGDGFGQRTVVAQAAGQHERHVVLHAFVHDAGFQPAALHRARDAARVVDRVDGAHVIAMAVLGLAAIRQADAERRAEQRGFDIVHAQRVAAQHRVDPVIADEFREARRRRRCGPPPVPRRRRWSCPAPSPAAPARRSGGRRFPPGARRRFRST